MWRRISSARWLFTTTTQELYERSLGIMERPRANGTSVHWRQNRSCCNHCLKEWITRKPFLTSYSTTGGAEAKAITTLYALVQVTKNVWRAIARHLKNATVWLDPEDDLEKHKGWWLYSLQRGSSISLHRSQYQQSCREFSSNQQRRV